MLNAILKLMNLQVSFLTGARVYNRAQQREVAEFKNLSLIDVSGEQPRVNVEAVKKIKDGSAISITGWTRTRGVTVSDEMKNAFVLEMKRIGFYGELAPINQGAGYRISKRAPLNDAQIETIAGELAQLLG